VNGPAENVALDFYYGPAAGESQASVSISTCGRRFADAPDIEPQKLRRQDNLAFLEFDEASGGLHRPSESKLHFRSDIVFASYWMLIGAREGRYPRDRWDNLDLEGTFLGKSGVLPMPLVSTYAHVLREHFRGAGVEPRPFPWSSGGASATFVFTHDVDYPLMIRWIECLRLMAKPSAKSMRLISGILQGEHPFWQFSEWVNFEKRLDTRPAFYFMARRGSLVEYARGTPDAFYDVQSPRFRELFRFLREEGCEVGLHASYHAHRSAGQLRREREILEEASGGTVQGNRHHFWHLDPAAPHETLRRAEEAGLVYDSSLEFEFYPGFRRGICHPFRVFHPGERRELGIVELPPTWMDDHFDRRLVKNGIADSNAYALGLVQATRETGGVAVVDYHPRGMNGDYFPRYGPWLKQFVEQHLDSTVNYCMPGEIVRRYLEYEKTLDADSLDRAIGECEAHGSAIENGQPPAARASGGLSVDFLRPEDATEWDAFVEGHPEGSIYHTMAWKAVTEEGLGHRAYYLRARTGDGKIAGVLPLFLVKGLFGRRLVSVPMRDRGGVLGRDREVVSALVTRAIELTRGLGCSYLELRSLMPMDAEMVRLSGLRCEENWVTTRVDLSPGPEQLWKALDKNAIRWAIKNAQRKGVHVELDLSAQGMQMFYELFVRTRTEMGIPPFPRSLFEAIWTNLVARGKANLFVVWKDAQPIHALISLLSKDTFVPAYAAPQNSWRKFYPSECAIWRSIEWAAQNGFRYYDFGADSPRQSGLLWFKKKWGGVQQPVFYYFFLNGPAAPPNFDSSSPAYTLVRKAWTFLPTRVSKSLGAWVTKQLS
jgi:FemAB-related protein (PEP-CTERM system-associated)